MFSLKTIGCLLVLTLPIVVWCGQSAARDGKEEQGALDPISTLNELAARLNVDERLRSKPERGEDAAPVPSEEAKSVDSKASPNAKTRKQKGGSANKQKGGSASKQKGGSASKRKGGGGGTQAEKLTLPAGKSCTQQELVLASAWGSLKGWVTKSAKVVSKIQDCTPAKATELSAQCADPKQAERPECISANLEGQSECAVLGPGERAECESVEFKVTAHQCSQEDLAAQAFWGRLMSQYVRLLQCRLYDEPGPQEELAVIQELQRVFSGAIAARAGSLAAVKQYVESADGDERAALRDAVEIRARLGDRTTRAAFLEQLKALGQAEGEFAAAVADLDKEGDGSALLDTLLRAERSSVAMGMAFVTEIDVQSRRSTRALSGLQLYWRAPASSDNVRAVDQGSKEFIQAIKQLLTMVTAEGIRKDKKLVAGAGKTELQRALCECEKDGSCRGALLIDLLEVNARIKPRGTLYFRRDLELLCRKSGPVSESTPDKKASSVTVVEGFESQCLPPKTAMQCTNQRAAVASELLNGLSLQFSMFGNVGYITVDRKVEAMTPARYQGVAISETWDPTTDRTPRLLERGLRIDNGGCSAELAKSLALRLDKDTYRESIGAIGEAQGAATARLSLVELGVCRLEISDASGKPAYAATVEYRAPATPDQAGDALGITVGQLYLTLMQAQAIATNSLLERELGKRASRASPASGLLLAGSPFLFDSRPRNDAWGWRYAAADTLGFVCGLPAMMLMVNARNEAEKGVAAAHDRSTAYLTTTYICWGLSLAARVGSTLHYWWFE